MAGGSKSFSFWCCSVSFEPVGAAASALIGAFSFRSCRGLSAAKVDLTGRVGDAERVGTVVVDRRHVLPLLTREPDSGRLAVVAALRQAALAAPFDGAQ